MRFIFLAVLPLTLSACEYLPFTEAGKIAGAEKRAAQELIDPSSAQFRNVIFVNDRKNPMVCGEINAKNRMGAYVGFRRFVSSPNNPELTAIDPQSDLSVDEAQMEYNRCVSSGYSSCKYDAERAAEARATRDFATFWNEHCAGN
jgi:hypothetical protein